WSRWYSWSLLIARLLVSRTRREMMTRPPLPILSLGSPCCKGGLEKIVCHFWDDPGMVPPPRSQQGRDGEKAQQNGLCMVRRMSPLRWLLFLAVGTTCLGCAGAPARPQPSSQPLALARPSEPAAPLAIGTPPAALVNPVQQTAAPADVPHRLAVLERVSPEP